MSVITLADLTVDPSTPAADKYNMFVLNGVLSLQDEAGLVVSLGSTDTVTAAGSLTAQHAIMGSGLKAVKESAGVLMDDFLVKVQDDSANDRILIDRDNAGDVSKIELLNDSGIAHLFASVDNSATAVVQMGMRADAGGSVSHVFQDDSGVQRADITFTDDATVGSLGITSSGDMRLQSATTVTLSHSGGDYTDPVSALENLGTSGAISRHFVGALTPIGAVTGNPGDRFTLVNGASSTEFIHTGASADNTSWTSYLDGGGETWAQTLALGNTSGGSDVVVSVGDALNTFGFVEVNQTETRFATTRPVHFQVNTIATPSSPITQATDFHGLDIVLSSAEGNDGGNNLGLYPFESTAKSTAITGTTQARLVAGYLQTRHEGAGGIVEEAVGLQLQCQNLSSGDITQARHMRIYDAANSGGGDISVQTAIYCDDLTTGSVSNYLIYSLGGNSYHQGSLGLGATTPDRKLEVYDDASHQAMFHGWWSALAGGASNTNHGSVIIGQANTFRGQVEYSGSSGKLFITNTFDNADGDIVFTTRMSGISVTPLTLKGSGAAEFGSTILIDQALLTYDSGTDELQSTKNFYAPEVRTDTSSLLLDNAMTLSTNSQSIEMVDQARSQNRELIGFDWDSTGSTAPTYPSLAAEATAPIQALEDASSAAFSFTIAVAVGNKTTAAIYKPAAAGTATFKVQFTDVSGVNLVSEYTQEITVPEIGTEVVFPLPNPISMNAGEFTFITYSGPALSGHVYSGDPTFGTGFYPWLSLTFNAITEKSIPSTEDTLTADFLVLGAGGAELKSATSNDVAGVFTDNAALTIRPVLNATVKFALQDNLGVESISLGYNDALGKSEINSVKPTLIQVVGGDLTLESGLDDIVLTTPNGAVLINGVDISTFGNVDTADVLTANFLVAGAGTTDVKAATSNDVAGAFVSADGSLLTIRSAEDSAAGYVLKSFADGFVGQWLYNDLTDGIDFFSEATTVNFATTGILNTTSTGAMNLTSSGVMTLDATGKMTLGATTSVDIESDQSNLIAFLNMETKGTNGSKINVAMGNVHPTGNVTLQPGEAYLYRDLTAGELTDILINVGDGIGPNNNRYLSMRAAADVAFTNNDIGTSTTPKWLRHGGVDPAASTLVTSWVVSRAGMLQNFSAHHAKPGVGAVLITYTVYVNGNPTALTVSVMANSTATVSNILNRVWINQFDRVSVQVTKAAAITTSPDVIETTMEYQ